MQHNINFQHNNHTNPVIMSDADYFKLVRLVQQTQNSESKTLLSEELDRAVVVKPEAFPVHAIGINSLVTVVDQATHVERTFTLVMPSQADMKKRMVSVLSPMGTALIGFRKGEYVSWQMPGGLKHFQITDVVNPANDENAPL